jgi:hypothetical protein
MVSEKVDCGKDDEIEEGAVDSKKVAVKLLEVTVRELGQMAGADLQGGVI